MNRTLDSVKALLVILFSAILSTQSVRSQQCKGGVQCLPLASCSELYRQLQQGNSPQLTTLLRRLHCGFENYNSPKVCCPPEYLISGADSRISGSEGAGGGFAQNAPFSPSSSYPEPSGQGAADPTSLLPSTRVCGIQNNDRIVGGKTAEIDEHPWMALLRYDKPRGSGFYCGGVLISQRYVLTAAHCVKGSDLPPNWRLSQVRLGEYNTSSVIDCIQGDCNKQPVDVPIEQIIAHEGYNPSDPHQHNDIALLRLSDNVPFSDFVKPICLPLSPTLQRSDFNGYTMEVAGWGKTESRSESDVKLKVRVPVVTRAECSRVYKRADRLIGPTQLCAGGESGQDSCRGDSGGALMGWTPSAENWLVAGIVSYGPSPCGTPGWPGVYTRVGAYVDWILSRMQP
ncbi:hypothetical protein JYU34_018754 [Plutella xylostella]|uniref:CLIP domain-containing serine protease n=1 Tax=Plutella xylostella TaxID=51655 RepID=A0ABQ7PYM3_PLUXY|nr:hypothetical protein JYU34_018754 [Plutella xylostella]